MRRIALIALTTLLLTGCTGGSDDSDGGKGGDATATATPKPTGPPCADIWKVGAKLPADYKSCVQDGAAAVQDVYECTDGTKLVAFNDAMYAVTGGQIEKPKVAPMQDTEEYGRVYSACTGE